MGPWWTAALMDQAIGRAVRIGQNEKVEVHRLILKEEASMNIDKKMLTAAERKRDLCTRFLHIARGSDAGSDPQEESDESDTASVASVASVASTTSAVSQHSFQQLPVVADDENPN
jgi:SNF2 family DNA or RNA helicase